MRREPAKTKGRRTITFTISGKGETKNGASKHRRRSCKRQLAKSVRHAQTKVNKSFYYSVSLDKHTIPRQLVAALSNIYIKSTFDYNNFLRRRLFCEVRKTHWKLGLPFLALRIWIDWSRTNLYHYLSVRIRVH
jgi:hypothetical protein